MDPKCQYIKMCQKFRTDNVITDLSDCSYHTFLTNDINNNLMCNR